MKRRLPFHALIVLVVLATKSFSLYPEFNSIGYFVLKFEDEIAQETRANATVYGVETWYRDFLWEIEYYVQYGPFMGYLPKPGSYMPEWTEINENSLADLIWDCIWLELDDVPGPGDGDQNIRPEIVQALYDDHYYNSGAWISFDPFGKWKWRSKYIEDLHSKPQNVQTKANCYGLPNYLSRDFAWSEEYSWNHANGLAAGWPADRCMLPFINLDKGSEGTTSWPYSFFDEDQDPRNGRAEFVHQHYATQRPWGGDCGYNPDGFHPGDALNAYDVIRLAEVPSAVDGKGILTGGNWELAWQDAYGNWTNVGRALHAWAYITTDEEGECWIYVYGAAGQAFLAKMTTASSWRNSWHTYFKKYGYNKILKAADYDRNWAEVTPVPSGY